MNDERGAPSDGANIHASAGQHAVGRGCGKFRVNLAGMGAEILFACGLILIGFLISLLSGR